MEWVRNAPWNKYKEDLDADGDIPEDKAVEAEEVPGPSGGGGVVFVNTRARAPREFYIRKADAEKHGYTRGCGGCSSWFRGLGRQPHTEQCRERFRGLMEGDAGLRNFAKRKRNTRNDWQGNRGGRSRKH